MSHSGHAVKGGTLAYTVTPSTTVAPTSNSLVTATFTLPSGMTYVSASGTGWSCSGSGQSGWCTRATPFGTGNGPAITLNTQIATTAGASLTPSVLLFGGGASNTANADNLTNVLTPPAAPSVTTPAHGSVIGSVTPTFSGTSDADATISVVVDGNTIGAASALADGTWSLTSPVSLSIDSHTVRAYATSPQGVRGLDSSTNTFTIAAALSVTPEAASGASVGGSFSQANPASGGVKPYTYVVASGSLPAGTTLDATTGTVSGTPTAAGAFSYAIKAIDSQGTPATATGTIVSGTIAKGSQTISFAALDNASLSASPLTLSATATSGLAVSFASTTGSVCTVSGNTLTPVATGTCSITASQGGDADWEAATDVLRSFTVTPANLTIAPEVPTGAAVGATYSQANPASGGVAPYTYALNAGGLPPGTTLDSATGTVSGTPTAAGTYIYWLRVTDSQGTPVSVVSTMVTATIAKGDQTISFTSIPPAGAAIGSAPYTVSAAASSALGVVYSLDGASTGCVLTGTTVTFTATGTCRINADQAGDHRWNAAPQAQQSFTVGAAIPLSASIGFTPAPLRVGQIGTMTLTFTNPNATTAPAFDAAITAPPGVTRVGGAPGGTCMVGPVLPPTSQTIALSNVVVPSGSCTVTFDYVGSIASSAAGFSLSAFTPLGYPTTSGVTGNAFIVVPTITEMTPTSGPVSQTVTITGTGFAMVPTDNIVNFGAATGTVTAASPNSLTVTAPAAGSGAVPVTVTVNGQTTPTGVTYTFIAPPAAGNVDTTAAFEAATPIDLSSSITGGHSSIAIVTGPAHGTADVAGSTVTYTPVAGYFGTDSFTYTATGPGGTSAEATVTLSVAVPPAPIVSDRGGISVAYESSGTDIDLASAVSGVYSSIEIATIPVHGGVRLSGTVVTYTPARGYSGEDIFTFTATGPGGTSASATVSISVATPPPPQVQPANVSTSGSTIISGTSVDIDLLQLIEGDVTSVQIVTQPEHGTVRLDTSGARTFAPMAMLAMIAPPAVGTLDRATVIYTPNPGFHGEDSFAFTATGPGGTSAPATISITVTGVEPVALDKSASAGDGETISIDLTDGATGGPFTGAQVVAVTPADAATTEIVASGNGDTRAYALRVTPAARFDGAVTIRYTLSNEFGASAPATITLNVEARPDPTTDPNVRAVSDAQVESTRRFARSQIQNFMRRTEQLHNGGGRTGVDMGVQLQARDSDSAFEGRDRYGRMGTGGLGEDGRAIDRTTAIRGTGQQGQRAEADGTSAAEPRKNAGETGERQVGSVALWSGGAIEIGTRDRTTNRSKISATTHGLSAGADIKVSPELVLGIGGGWGEDRSDIGEDAARVSSDSTVLAAYGSFAPVNGMFVDGVIAIGDLGFTTQRRVSETGAIARGVRDGSMTFGALSLGIDRGGERLRWSAYGRGEWLVAELDAYAETGAGRMDLRFDARDLTSLQSVLGARLDFDLKAGSTRITPSLRGEWQHEFENGGLQFLDYADITGKSMFSLGTEDWRRDQFELTLGSAVTLPSLWTFDFEMAVRAARGQSSATLRAMIAREF